MAGVDETLKPARLRKLSLGVLHQPHTEGRASGCDAPPNLIHDGPGVRDMAIGRHHCTAGLCRVLHIREGVSQI